MQTNESSMILLGTCSYHLVVKLLKVLSPRTDFKGKTFWLEQCQLTEKPRTVVWTGTCIRV